MRKVDYHLPECWLSIGKGEPRTSCSVGHVRVVWSFTALWVYCMATSRFVDVMFDYYAASIVLLTVNVQVSGTISIVSTP